MLQKLREKTTGWVAGLIVGMIAVPFAFFGVNNYFSQQVATWVAKIEIPSSGLSFGSDAREISQDQFRARFEQYRQQMRQQLGENYDAREFDNPTVKRQVLDRMIDEELLLAAADKAGVVVPDATIAREIMDIPAFQVDGRFDQTQYRLLLQGQGMSISMFERQLRDDLIRQLLPQQIAASAVATDADVDAFIRLQDQRRDLRYLAIAAPESIDTQVSDEQVATWYEENSDRYRNEEQVVVEYVEVDAADLAVPTAIDEATLRERYEDQKSRFVEPEQRLAAHILVQVPPNADATTEQGARDKAAELAKRIRDGEDFAEVAAAESDDVGSRNDGGELGWIEQGMLDAGFEQALFALAEGEISEPVRSSEGWHVIQLRDVREGEVKSFVEVREELEREVLDSERERAYSDLVGRLLDQTYRDPSSLRAAAEALGLEIKRSEAFGRAGGEGVAANPQVVSAAFSSEVLREGNISDMVELGPNHALVLKVADHTPAEPMPIDAVRDRVVAEVVADRRENATATKAETLLTKARDGAALESLAAEAGNEVQVASGAQRTASSPDRAILEKAFALPRPTEDKRSLGLAEVADGRYALVEVTAVQDGDPSALDEAFRNALRQQLSRMHASLEVRAYIDALRERYRVSVAEERL